MGIRSKSRELALQALFYMDTRENFSHELTELYLESFPMPEKAIPFFRELVKGVIEKKEKIDPLIERFSENWKINRISCVERNVIRIAVYEMIFCSDIPLKVSINEAINMGKQYGTQESGAFINGILDSVRIALEKKEIHIKELND